MRRVDSASAPYPSKIKHNNIHVKLYYFILFIVADGSYSQGAFYESLRFATSLLALLTAVYGVRSMKVGAPETMDENKLVPTVLRSSTQTREAPIVSANYSKLSDNFRRLAPHGLQCSMFCGGLHCKYENPDNWTSSDYAIQGIFSNWYAKKYYFY